MSYTPQTRDKYRLAVAAVTGVASVAALSASGWIAGAEAADHNEELAHQSAVKQAAEAQATAEYQAKVAEYEASLAAEPREEGHLEEAPGQGACNRAIRAGLRQLHRGLRRQRWLRIVQQWRLIRWRRQLLWWVLRRLVRWVLRWRFDATPTAASTATAVLRILTGHGRERRHSHNFLGAGSDGKFC